MREMLGAVGWRRVPAAEEDVLKRIAQLAGRAITVRSIQREKRRTVSGRRCRRYVVVKAFAPQVR